MKVKELIEELKKYPEAATVCLEISGDDYTRKYKAPNLIFQGGVAMQVTLELDRYVAIRDFKA